MRSCVGGPCIWRAEDSLQEELAVSSHHLGPRDGTQVIWVSIKHLHLLGNLHSLPCENQVENTEFSSLLDPVYGNTDSTKSESLNIKNVSSD